MSEVNKKEEKILKFWGENDIFQKSVKKEAPNGDYVFYDGPPFATGTPHYGHVVASLMKDVVPRYWTMKGFRIERKWGWDTHGLPVENIVEKELGFKTKKEIEEYGIDKFNELCRSKVLGYANEWKKIIPRLGRWVDMDNDYKTMDLEYMESIWWVFKQLWDKGLVYEDYKSMHICPRCETTLSQQEVSEGYADIKDISVTAEFELEDEPSTFVLAWTTTPWTLPGNVALAVGEDINYVNIRITNNESGIKNNFILAKERLEVIKDEYEIVGEFKGKDLIGKSYKPLFDDFAKKEDLENRENGWKIYGADFVTTEDGTGVVHIAPAFGEDDMILGQKESLPFVQHVKMDGHIEGIEGLNGLSVKPIDNHQATDVEVLKNLAGKGLLFAKEKYEHSYPHCWRCDTPLINYATSSWFVSVTKIKEKAIEKAKNINWTPEHIKEGRFGKWLEGARDWSVSRQRFWASVMPIWVCEECGEKRVYGGVADLEKDSGEKVTDLHKHIVDKITVPCECGKTMKRIPDVLDTWFDSGSMPYAQMHYPFENKEKFDNNFPAEFIAEGIDQTRAWFYYLHVLAIAIKGEESFKNVIVNGIMLAEDGKKMSKRLQNYPDPMEVVNKYGADSLRFYLLSKPVMRAEDLNFSEKEVDEVNKKIISKIRNIVSFYEMYKDKVETTEEVSGNVLDKWIVLRLRQAGEIITKELDKYNLDRASRPIELFVDDFSNWFIRRSRDRFKDHRRAGQEGQDAVFAMNTLRCVLEEFSKLIAPFMPFISEEVYQAVKIDGQESVHLEDWPKFDESLAKDNILEDMEKVRGDVSVGLDLRLKEGIKVRQPLASFETQNEFSNELNKLIKDELNVKEIKKGKDYKLDTKITLELKEEGMVREVVRAVQGMRKKAGLTPDEKIELVIETDEKGKSFIDKFEADIKKGTNTSLVKFSKSEDGKELKVGDFVFKLLVI